MISMMKVNVNIKGTVFILWSVGLLLNKGKNLLRDVDCMYLKEGQEEVTRRFSRLCYYFFQMLFWSLL